MQHILVINAGSSSMKYQLIDSVTGERQTSGLVERIGEGLARVKHESDGHEFEWQAEIADHTEAFAQMARGFGLGLLSGASGRAVFCRRQNRYGSAGRLGPPLWPVG